DRATRGADDAVALDVTAVRLERAGGRIERVRAPQLLQVRLLGGRDEEPGHQRRYERGGIASLRFASRARPLEALGDLFCRAAHRVELVGEASAQPLHPRPDPRTAEDQGWTGSLDRAREELGVPQD